MSFHNTSLWPVFTAASVFLQLFSFQAFVSNGSSAHCAPRALAPPQRPHLHRCEFLFKPRPFPKALNTQYCTSFSCDLIFVSAQNGTLQSTGDPAAGEPTQGPLGSRGRGTSYCACGCGRGKARRARPPADFPVPVPAAGPAPVPAPPAPEVKASPAQLSQPWEAPGGKRRSQKRRPGEEWRHPFLRTSLLSLVGFLSFPQGEDKVTGGRGRCCVH